MGVNIIFETLTILLKELDDNEYGDWIVDKEHKGTMDDPIQMPFVIYGQVVRKLEREIYAFDEGHPEMELRNYQEILEKNNIRWETRSMENADVNNLDGQCVMALLLGAVRAERFCDGALLGFCESGAVKKWLERLLELDDV